MYKKLFIYYKYLSNVNYTSYTPARITNIRWSNNKYSAIYKQHNKFVITIKSATILPKKMTIYCLKFLINFLKRFGVWSDLRFETIGFLQTPLTAYFHDLLPSLKSEIHRQILLWRSKFAAKNKNKCLAV